MAPPTPQTYADIDWATLRANAFARKGWREKGPADWDKKASSFAGRVKSSAYSDLVLSHLPLSSTFTVLDIGSGPGTLSIPIAHKVKQVTAIDFSIKMLDTLDEIADSEGLSNIQTKQCAWEDDWHEKGLVPHDIAIASRSMGVKDLPAALKKIDSFGSKYVFLADRIGSTPFEPEAFKAVGRTFSPGPDYIFTINTLYTLDIFPNVTILQLEKDVTYSSMAEAMASYSWMIHDITADETLALLKYLKTKIIKSDNNRLTIRRESPPLWALIWWEKT